MVPALGNESTGRAHDLRPADHHEAVVLEVSVGAWWGTAVSRFPPPVPGPPVSPIETDFNRALVAVDRGQGRQQLRLIPRHDDETRKHGSGPRHPGVQERRQCDSGPQILAPYASPEGRASTNDANDDTDGPAARPDRLPASERVCPAPDGAPTSDDPMRGNHRHAERQ